MKDMHVSDVASGVPVWVYGLLVVLILLGARRIRTRELPIVGALLPVAAFLIWSLYGAAQFAQTVGAAVAIGAWLGGAGLGAVATLVFPEARGERLAGGRVRIRGSWLPLGLYLGVFIIRFAYGVWAAIDPSAAVLATGIGMAVGAAMTARLLIGVARWTPVPEPEALRPSRG